MSSQWSGGVSKRRQDNMGQGKEIVKQMWDAMESHNLEKVGELLTSDCALKFPGGIVMRGREEFKGFLSVYLKAFPDLRHETLDVIEMGNRMAVELRALGTHKGPMQT